MMHPGLTTLGLKSPVILAPMSGVTDRPYRDSVQRYGAGLVVTEMIASKAVLMEIKDSRKLNTEIKDEPNMAVQLAGVDPDVIAEAAKVVEQRGAKIIDLNFGCPAKKVTKKSSGSALMRDEALCARIFDAAVRAVSIPVTVKMRLGWDDGSVNAPTIAQMAQDAGVQMITVHGRTRCQFYKGQADWRAVHAVREAIDLPLVVNGDIVTIQDADDALAKSGADAVMVGRGSQGRPWLLQQIAQHLMGEVMVDDPSGADQAEECLVHFDATLRHYGMDLGMRIARKHLVAYGSGMRDAAQYRAQVAIAPSPKEVEVLVRRYIAA